VKPVKRSVAVLIRSGGRILAIRRPDADDELPGIWGLPAGSFRDSETLQDLIQRIGRDKLGVSLTPLRKLGEGVQDRPRYRLEMELWEASMHEEPIRAEWKWTTFETLRQGSEQGSLCCKLALDTSGASGAGGGLDRP
jgi:8-oxo-dGTP diphosphatase